MREIDSSAGVAGWLGGFFDPRSSSTRRETKTKGAGAAEEEGDNDHTSSPSSSSSKFEGGTIPICTESSGMWVYPLDEKYPERQYQVEISESAILRNTLVSLPTGLGKTLIAAVVMYNYYRWYPTGKVVCE
jgi:superfamily II DNA or RNA helicase